VARKYLGKQDHYLGRSLPVFWENDIVDFEITGILKKVPPNSHIRFDMLVSLSSHAEETMNEWFGNLQYTYLLLPSGINNQKLEEKFPVFLKKYVAAEFLSYFGPDIDVTDVFQIKLKPLLDIHLNPSREYEIGPQGNQLTVYLFSMVGILILVIACINFINLSTARAHRRAREIGLRKTIGANRITLISQFLGESLLYATIAMIFAIILINLFLPIYQSLSGKMTTFESLLTARNFLILMGTTFITGIFAGLYPAFYLSAFHPTRALKNDLGSGGGRSFFRRLMVVIQFSMSILIIISTFTVFNQLVYMQNKELGFDKENIIAITVAGNQIHRNYEAFRNTLIGDSRIRNVSASSYAPGTKFVMDTNFKRNDNGDTYNLMLLFSDYDFIDTYGLEIIQGRKFSREFPTDSEQAIIVNERALITLGYQPEEVVGKKLQMTLGNNAEKEVTVIGVLKNFHLQSLRLRIQPMVFLMAPYEQLKSVSVRFGKGNVQSALELLSQKWQEFFPEAVFQFEFIEDRLLQLYISEQRMRNLFILFSSLSIFIACLGLWGLAVYSAEDRTKEIGIRKVMGASISQIVITLSTDFTKWVIYANIIAWPAAYYFMNQWLQSFAYKTELNIWLFVVSGFGALIIAFFTVSYQAMKAALANPVNSLRYE
jgi:putative ABC transport system permease protein